MKIKPAKWLFLPLEVKVRELESKVLLSCCAAEKGFCTIIGPNGFNLKKDLPGGAYFDKCISPSKLQFLREQKFECNNKIVCLDEEGLVHQKDHFIRERTSIQTIKLTDKVFCWGNDQCHLLQCEYNNEKDKFLSTGSPRVDVWASSNRRSVVDQADALKNKFGEYILFPSNFSAVNNANGDDFVLRQYKSYGLINEKEEEQFLTERLSYVRDIFEGFKAMIFDTCQEFKHINFVVRMHPGDNMTFWQSFAEKIPNLFCSYEGSLLAAIKGSILVIHNNCTSAIEGFYAHHPVIAYNPIEKDPRFEHNLPNRMSIQTYNIADLHEKITDRINGKLQFHRDAFIDLINNHITHHDHELASDRIAKALHSLEIECATLCTDNYISNEKSIFSKFKRRLITFFNIGFNLHMTRAYKRQKNPGICISEIECLISDYKTLYKRFGNISVFELGTNQFLIYPHHLVDN